MPPSASEPVTPHIQSLIFSDGEWISHGEFALRRRLCFGFRLALATFCSAQLWEFMFNPIWMHGYLWSLNQQYSIVDPSTGGSLADKSAVAILEHQLVLTGHWERAGHAVLSALASWLLLHCAGFGRADRTVWRLLWLSICFGAVAGLTRTVQQQQRLYPCVHECFFGCLLLFLNGLCLCLRLPSAIKEKTLELEDEVDEKRREKCE